MNYGGDLFVREPQVNPKVGGVAVKPGKVTHFGALLRKQQIKGPTAPHFTHHNIKRPSDRLLVIEFAVMNLLEWVPVQNMQSSERFKQALSSE